MTDAQMLLESLARLGCPCELDSVQEAPQTVRYALRPAAGVRMKSFRGIEPDLMLALSASSVRVECPVPGTATVGVELPRRDRAMVSLSDVEDHASLPLTAAIGVDVDGGVVTLPIADLPHLLVAGATGSGKSSLLNSMLCSLLRVAGPDDLDLLLIDVKMVELTHYEGLPHLHGGSVITNADDAIDALWHAVEVMDAVYMVMNQLGVKSLEECNARLEGMGERKIPRRLIVVDELGDLILRGRGRVESAIVRIGQLGRACGVHLCLSTQSPRANIVTGLIKSNLPARVCLSTASALDSRVVMDRNGGESLLGRGDALYDDGKSNTLVRFQSAYVSSDEIASIVGRWTETPTLEMAAV